MVLPPQRTAKLVDADGDQSFVHKLQFSISKGLPHAAPVPALRTEEHELDFETSWHYWDITVPGYCEKSGVYVAHLSLTGLGSMLSPSLFVATCLKHVELFVGKVRTCRRRIPTLDAFASSVDSWLMVRVLETASCSNGGKDCVRKIQSGQTLSRTLHKQELRAPGCPFL